MVYLSTGGFKNLSPIESIKLLNKNKIYDIELSGGKYCKSLIQKLSILKKKNNFLLHNYFPPPKKSFVINLASLNSTVNKKSFNHIIKSINLSRKLNAKYYSFHAGFYIDPKINELGKKIKFSNFYNEKKSKKIFVENIKKIIAHAKKKKVTILIENNVITKSNLVMFKKNPLMFCDYKDLTFLKKKIKSKNFGFLLDIGHLKVSCKTLKKNFYSQLYKISKECTAYHLSENDGYIDSNGAIKKKSRIWNYISNKKVPYVTLEVYTKNINLLKKQIVLTKKIFKKFQN